MAHAQRGVADTVLCVISGTVAAAAAAVITAAAVAVTTAAAVAATGHFVHLFHLHLFHVIRFSTETDKNLKQITLIITLLFIESFIHYRRLDQRTKNPTSRPWTIQREWPPSSERFPNGSTSKPVLNRLYIVHSFQSDKVSEFLVVKQIVDSYD